MFVTIINDCRDENARGRQESRIASLLGQPSTFVGVDSDLEAGMQLIDILDATEGREGLVLVNVAPRGGHTTQWENGTPFAYFYYHRTLVITSVDGFALSAVKSLGLVDEVSLLDTHTAAAAMQAAGYIDALATTQLPVTQFRSFDFTPRVGAYLLEGNTVPSTPYPLTSIAPLPQAIWHIDNFGNCKTTLTEPDIHNAPARATRFGTLPMIHHLRDVPDGTAAITVGSSGLRDRRFLELVIQRGNFAERHGARLGDDVFTDQNYFHHATKN
jgi:hypothetical protein